MVASFVDGSPIEETFRGPAAPAEAGFLVFAGRAGTGAFLCCTLVGAPRHLAGETF